MKRLALVLALALLAWGAGARPEWFELRTSAVMNGEVWRLYTGHLVHGSLAHYAYDVGALSVLLLFARANKGMWLLPGAIGVAIAALPGVEHYYGLSALLHAWVVLEAASVASSSAAPWARVVGVAVTAGVLLKASWETVYQTSILTQGTDMGGPVLFASHLVGGIVGLLWAGLLVYGSGSAGASRKRRSSASSDS